MSQQQLDLPGMLEAGVADGEGVDAASVDVHDRGELHVHMNGTIPTAIVREILVEEAAALPPGFDFERDPTRTTPSRSLAEYLTSW